MIPTGYELESYFKIFLGLSIAGVFGTIGFGCLIHAAYKWWTK